MKQFYFPALVPAGLYAAVAALIIVIFWGCLHGRVGDDAGCIGVFFLWLPWALLFPALTNVNLNMADTLWYATVNVLIIYGATAAIGKVLALARSRKARRGA